jgi:hypothetical protein
MRGGVTRSTLRRRLCGAEGTCGYPRADAAFHWSARAIFQNAHVDLLWDRQGIEGEATEAEREALCTWLTKKALPHLRWLAKRIGFLRVDEDREVTVRGDGYELRANPRQSHGYLYLSAAPCAEAIGVATPSSRKTRRVTA